MSISASPAGIAGKAGISAVLIARNEEGHIAQVLENIADFAAECLVIDMESTDRTVELAKLHTSLIYSYPITQGFNVARNLGHEKASCEWILVIDADERLPASLKLRLKAIVDQDLCDYVSIPRRNFILGHPLRHGVHREDWQIRLYKKSCVTPWPESVHLGPSFDGRMLRLADRDDLAILHYSSPSIDSLIARVLKYTPQDALELRRIGYKFSVVKLISYSLLYFFRSYIVKRGFLDGVVGLIYAVHMSYYYFMARARVWEYEQVEETGMGTGGADALT